jgi:O-antigen/teichoic acid export membrane protein
VKRTFFVNLIFVVLLNLLIKPLWALGVERGVQNTLGFGDYGAYYALLNLSFLFAGLLDFGIQSYTSRLASREEAGLDQLFSQVLVLKIIGFVIYAVISWLLAMSLGIPSAQWLCLAFLLLSQACAQFILFLRSGIAGKGNYKWDSLLSVCDKAFMILFVAAVLYLPSLKSYLNITVFAFLQCLAYVIALIISLILFRLSKIPMPRPQDFSGVKELVRKAFPYALIGLLMTIYFRADTLMIRSFCGNKENGIYAAAYRLLDILNMFSYLFAALLLPMFGKLLRKGESVRELSSLAARLLFGATWLIACIVFLERDAIFSLLYKEPNDYGADVMGFLLFSLPFVGLLYVYGTLLTAEGDIWHMNKMVGMAVGLNLGFNYLFIQHYGALGAAVVAVLTHAFVAIMNFNRTFTKFNWGIKWTASLRVFSLLILMPIGLYLVDQLFDNYVLASLMMALAGITFLFVLRWWRYAEMKELVLEKIKS